MTPPFPLKTLALEQGSTWLGDQFAAGIFCLSLFLPVYEGIKSSLRVRLLPSLQRFGLLRTGRQKVFSARRRPFGRATELARRTAQPAIEGELDRVAGKPRRLRAQYPQPPRSVMRQNCANYLMVIPCHT